MADEAPKIVVDSDWKSQARAEKERLAAQEKAKQQKPAGPASGGAGSPAAAAGRGQAAAAAMGGGGEPMEGLPEASFQTLLGTMITQALMYMGAFPDPETGTAIVSLEHARFHIDLLTVLQEKTKGNLTEQEQQDLDQSLNELRMRFVEIGRAVAEARLKRQSQGAAGTGGPGGGPNIADLGAQLRGGGLGGRGQ